MTWLRCPRPRPRAATRLVCFAHAGGSATAYREWPALLPESVELHGVQLPGRADRFGEPFPESFQSMAAEIAAETVPLLDRRFALFGHSMGALLAYEVTRLLEERGLGPVRLFVSGCRAPHEIRRDDRRLSEHDDDRLVSELTRLGGTDAEILTHPAMRELILPYVRGDFRLIENHRSRPGPRCAPRSRSSSATPTRSSRRPRARRGRRAPSRTSPWRSSPATTSTCSRCGSGWSPRSSRR
nr:hypothetical protein GCM10020093_038560 [Planobispora longispora]